MRFIYSIAIGIVFATCGIAATCEGLASLALPQTTVTLAATVAAGGFTPPGGSQNPAPGDVAYKDIPGFCRVTATLKPSNDSDIKIEVWLPAASAWNGKFMAVGNGGWAGTISYSAMAQALSRGYATSSTDTGHAGTGADASFALGHAEKLVDFGYRAVHEMTVKSKAIASAYYDQSPKFSYWNGCSTGGRQGLKEAQRFPDDYDGIVAGAPANNWTNLMTQLIAVAQAVHKDEASYIPPNKYPLIHNAVLEACDAADGVKDGLLDNPTRCKFDPKILACKGEDGPQCLSAAQVEAVRKIYAPVTNPRTKQELHGGFLPGSELLWGAVAGPQVFPIPVSYFKYVVFKNPDWNYLTLNFDSDIALANQIDGGAINTLDPNLKAFFGHGGKLLQYHGWSDHNISPLDSVTYRKSVVDAVGSNKVDDSYRLFMIPGMAHCRGGEGPDRFDAVSALEQWVEKGKAPESIIASRYKGEKADLTRPLCPYPQVAVYKGSGSADEAVNFTCKAK